MQVNSTLKQVIIPAPLLPPHRLLLFTLPLPLVQSFQCEDVLLDDGLEGNGDNVVEVVTGLLRLHVF